MSKKRAIAVDLFAGAGGMSLGFEQAGFDVLCAVEIDPIHAGIHEFNFPFCDVICGSVIDLTAEDIRTKTQIKDQEIDVVFGGPPCQGFSLIGKRVLDDPRNQLVFHFLRLVLELKPKYFVMENVPGMVRGKHQQLLEELIEKFQFNGYKVVEKYQILNSAFYGVPQNRQRLFLLGCRDDLSLPKYPDPITKPNKSKQLAFDFDLPSTPTVWEAIQDLPTIEDYPELYHQDWVNATFGEPSDYVKKLLTNHDHYGYERHYNPQILTSSLRSKHSVESQQRFADTPHGKAETISRFHKLDPHGICNTLRAGTASNKGAFTSPRPIHPFIPRCITVREAARLHSYPDWFRFHPTKWHGFRQIGNSVPPLLAKAVGLSIIKALGIIPIKPEIKHHLGDEKFLRFDMSEAAKYYDVDPHIIEPRNRKNNQKHE
jgi:DNA (cytosine-5)-methyltransferase 1